MILLWIFKFFVYVQRQMNMKLREELSNQGELLNISGLDNFSYSMALGNLSYFAI